MSIPRSLSLRRTGDGLRLIQTPVKELQSLRQNPVRLDDLRVSESELSLADKGIAGDRLEILAEIEPANGAEFGLIVRKGNGQQTIVGYDSAKQELFVDRTRSGESNFHPNFAGRHAGPLETRDGRILLHLFIDTASVEVFGNQGETVITDTIFPEPSSQGVAVYSKHGDSRIRSLQVWQLKPAW
jgi:fructan beta-fructosidase